MAQDPGRLLGWAEAAYGGRPTTGRAEAKGRDWHTRRLGWLPGGHNVGRDRRRPRPGRRSRATAPTDRAQQPPGRARAGLPFTYGPCPRNVKDGLGPSCGRYGEGEISSDHTQLKVKLKVESDFCTALVRPGTGCCEEPLTVRNNR